MQPNLDFPFWWIPLMLVAWAAGLSTILSDGAWPRYIVAAFFGAFIGTLSGFRIWWPTDRISASFVPLIVISAMLASAAVSLVTGLALRRVTLSNHKHRRVLWFALVCCVAFGPVVVALTPPLVAERMARNDQVAKKRIVALNSAAVQTLAEIGASRSICDSAAFSERDWQYIVGNYVKRDGYIFSIYCHEKAGYVIDARPDRNSGDGTRYFCADESGTIGCGMKWDGARRECAPCTK
jgi:hypothetical protein